MAETNSEQRFYQLIAASSNSNQDYVVPDGAIIDITEMGASSPGVASSVEIRWDPAGTNILLLGSYGDTVQRSLQSFVGDGAKLMRITLTNTNEFEVLLGGYFIFEQVI